VPAETVTLETLDGLTLVAELAVPRSPWAAAVVTHPHPLYGGDMHNPVVEALFRALHDAGVAAVRFDFRGTGSSEGRHDGGELERLDVVAALDVAAPFAFDGPLVVCGYSFGAAVALDVTDPRVAGWAAVAPPLGRAGRSLAGPDHRPKLVLVPEHDQFTPPPAMRLATETWRSTTIEVLSMADHFLAGRTRAAADAVTAFVGSLAGHPPEGAA
jgi:uncharacterized protein